MIDNAQTMTERAKELAEGNAETFVNVRVEQMFYSKLPDFMPFYNQLSLEDQESLKQATLKLIGHAYAEGQNDLNQFS